MDEVHAATGTTNKVADEEISMTSATKEGKAPEPGSRKPTYSIVGPSCFELDTHNPGAAHFFWMLGFDVWDDEQQSIYAGKIPPVLITEDDDELDD